jgi:hypothetical protein
MTHTILTTLAGRPAISRAAIDAAVQRAHQARAEALGGMLTSPVRALRRALAGLGQRRPALAAARGVAG